MSAHLQFGPEWMRKGPGKSSTTPTSEAQLSFASDAGGGLGSASPQAPAATSSTAASKSAWTTVGQPAQRRNLSNLNSSSTGVVSSPASVSAGTAAVTSPGAFSFAAAASGVGQAGVTSPTSQNQAGERVSQATMGAEGDVSRYTKRLLSLYSSERVANGSESPDTSMVSALNASSTNQHAPTQRPKKTFGFNSDREPGRRMHSSNAEGASQSNGVEYRGAPRGYAANAAGGTDARDSYRPGLFQRGSGTTTGATIPTLPVAPSQGRERVISGIQGGVLGSVLSPSASSPKRSGKGDDAPSQTSIAQDGLDEFGQPAKYTRTSHGPDGQPLTRDDWVRLRRERHPNEGPVGPPSDHSGGFARGFEQRRERTSSARRIPINKPAGEFKQTPMGTFGDANSTVKTNAESTVDEMLQSNAAKLVDSLRLDEDETALPTVVSSEASNWSPEIAQWFYRDNAGQVQGPFKASMMQDWYAAKYFNDDLLVRQDIDEHFTPLGRMLQLIGNSSTPFLVQPSQWQVNRIPPSAHQTTGFGLSGGLPNYSLPVDHREPPRHDVAAMNWNTSTPSRIGFNDGSMDVFRRQSPSIHPYGASMGGHLHGNPFGSPSPFLAGAQMKGQDEYLAMIRENEFAEQRRMLEHRQAQLAALALSRSGLGQVDSPTPWNANIRATTPSDWQAVQESRIEQSDDVLRLTEPQFDAANLSPVSIVAEPTPADDPAAVTGEERAPVSAVKELDSKAKVSDGRVRKDAVPHAQPAIQETAEDIPTQITAAEAEAMTTVRTKKSRKGKKLNIVPDVFDDQPSGNDSSGLETTQPEGQSSMTNEVSLSSIMPSSTAAGPKAAPWAATPLGQESGSGTSLRAIQEAEERRARVNRQLRQQQASIATSGANSSQTPVSMSWGLAMPSSRDQTSAQQPQSASQTGGTPSGPVWNSASQAPKKTLAEIQQEEERRQRALQAATANANAANDLASSAQSMSASSMPSRIRGYADSANRAQAQSTSSVQSSVTTPPASGWSLVGASGKSTTGSPASAPLTQSSAPTVRSVSVPQKSESVVKTNSVYDSGNGKAPSSDFLQYCREQLRGLNNMKADDFIEMLLSFPIDATSDVVEIIAESVYAASSTLDGRRFAADFVAKRKQDAQGAFKSVSNGLHTDKISGQPSASNGFNYSASSRLTGARSASDVLQSQPKTTNDNFGGFKVVKAKGGKKRG